MRSVRLLLVVLLCSCQSRSLEREGKSLFSKKETKVTPVSVVTLTRHEIPLVIRTQGKTEASDRFQAKAPDGGGRIDRLFVQEGQKVEPGEPLVKFSDSELRLKLELAKSEITEAEAGLNEAKYQKENRDRLLEQQKLTDLEVEGLDEKVALYEATIDRARDEIDLYESQLDNLQIHSPIAGLVTKKEATEGEEVEEGKVLVEVVKIDPLRFAFNIPLEAAGALEKGAPVTVKFSSLGNRDIAGEILLIGTEAGAEGTVGVKLSFPNETMALKTEMAGEVTLSPPLTKKVVVVPPAALIKSERSTYVYKVIGEKVKKTAVTLEEENGGQVTVTRGLEEGDRIVSSNPEALEDGETIEIQTNQNY